MMTTPSYTRLFPELAASVASTASSNSEVDEWIQRLVKEARTAELVLGGVWRSHGHPGLDRFQHGFELARAVFAPDAVRVPEPQEFSPAIEWKAFASALKDSASSRYELVIAPHGLGLGRWQTIGENHVLARPFQVTSVQSLIASIGSMTLRHRERETVSPFGRTLEWTARLLPAKRSHRRRQGKNGMLTDKPRFPRCLSYSLVESSQDVNLLIRTHLRGCQAPLRMDEKPLVTHSIALLRRCV